LGDPPRQQIYPLLMIVSPDVVYDPGRPIG
jgi:hypothetical protein